MAARWKTTSAPSSRASSGSDAQVELRGRRTQWCAATGGKVRFLERPRVVRDKRVDADDVVAVLEQPLAQVGADKPGRAGDKAFHP